MVRLLVTWLRLKARVPEYVYACHQHHIALAIPGSPVMVRLLVTWLRLGARVPDYVYACQQHHIALAPWRPSHA